MTGRNGDLPLEALAAFYPIGAWRSVEPIKGGKNDHAHVVADGGQYVLRRSQRLRSAEALAHEHALIDYLRQHGYPAPGVVRTVDGGTYATVRQRLYTLFVFVEGDRYDGGRPEHLCQAGRSLARYHQLVAGYRPPVNGAEEEHLARALARRSKTFAELMVRASSDHAELLVDYRTLLNMANRVVEPLAALHPELPKLVIHGGCRRGSTIFDGDRLVAVLDFDSAHREARALDIAVALHDFGKIYGDPASPDFKVALDLDRVAAFMAAYGEIETPSPAELEAVPLMMRAKRIKRAMGKTLKYLRAGDVPPNEGKKLHMELRRLRWLDEHDAGLREAVAGAANVAEPAAAPTG
jgi:homoserine kinase type II